MIAFFPGSFDPFTIGHKSIVDRALPLFDLIIIGVGINEGKRPMFSAEERVEVIENLYCDNPKVSVQTYSGLTVDAASRSGADVILRGVRSVKDFEYERDIADVNRDLTGIETILLYSLPEYAHISSSIVRELISFGADVAPYLP